MDSKYRCADPAVYPAIYPAGYDELVLEGHYISGGWRLVLDCAWCGPSDTEENKKVRFYRPSCTDHRSVITNLVLKTAVTRIRPYDAVEGLVPLVKKLGDYSFPSGHTCASFSCAVVYYKMYPDIKGKGAMVLAVLIALSRLYVGVHYPTDVLGGAIVGWLSAILALKISVFTEKKKAAV